MAYSLFWCWERSVWQLTTNPVGRWVSRTAEATFWTFWPPGAAGAEEVNLQVFGPNLHLCVFLVGGWEHDHLGEGGVAKVVAVEGGKTHQPVNALFRLEVAEGQGSGNLQRRGS